MCRLSRFRPGIRSGIRKGIKIIQTGIRKGIQKGILTGILTGIRTGIQTGIKIIRTGIHSILVAGSTCWKVCAKQQKVWSEHLEVWSERRRFMSLPIGYIEVTHRHKNGLSRYARRIQLIKVDDILYRVWVDVVYWHYRYNEKGEIDVSFIPDWYELDEIVPLTTRQRMNELHEGVLSRHSSGWSEHSNGWGPTPLYDRGKYLEIIENEKREENREENRRALESWNCAFKNLNLQDFPLFNRYLTTHIGSFLKEEPPGRNN